MWLVFLAWNWLAYRFLDNPLGLCVALGFLPRIHRFFHLMLKHHRVLMLLGDKLLVRE